MISIFLSSTNLQENFFVMFFCLIYFWTATVKHCFLAMLGPKKTTYPFQKNSRTLREIGTAILQGFVSPLALFKNRNY